MGGKSAAARAGDPVARGKARHLRAHLLHYAGWLMAKGGGIGHRIDDAGEAKGTLHYHGPLAKISGHLTAADTGDGHAKDDFMGAGLGQRLSKHGQFSCLGHADNASVHHYNVSPLPKIDSHFLVVRLIV